jgi:hypothetical protein
MRQRRNQAAGQATLPAESTEKRRVPPLPKGRAWHKMTRLFWRDTWSSPMAGEFLKADIHGLYILVELVEQFWTEPSQALAAEIRLQRTCFGLTPIDRRRLQWEVERVEAVTRRPPPRPSRLPSDDPRRNLALV